MWRRPLPGAGAVRGRPLAPVSIRQAVTSSLVSRTRTGSLHVPSTRAAAAAAAGSAGQLELAAGDEDFYSILGVHPSADGRAIKAAYYALMRQYHPDQAAAASGGGPGLPADDATAFAALLNEIYTTLADPAARATYDAIAGFSAAAVNPFSDTSYPADQVFVDEVSCIGCGKCVRACPDVFAIEASKYGRARVLPGAPLAQLEEDVEVAILTCPVDCIHWVTSPQLSLLEAALAGMERVDAFLLLRNARAPGNVFHEAQRAWQKRQARIASLSRQRQAEAACGGGGAAVSRNSWGGFWSQYVDTSPTGASGWDAAGGGGGGERDGARDGPGARRVADLAASAAIAMRRWRVYHRAASASQKVLTE